MPTLFSAMTGYEAVSALSVEIPPAEFSGDWSCADLGGCIIYLCGGPGAGMYVEGSGLQRAWGQVLDSMRFDYSEPMATSSQDPSSDELSVVSCKATPSGHLLTDRHTDG